MAGAGYSSWGPEMKAPIRHACLLFLPLFLTGCYVYKGRLCSITMPQIYCDEEAYKKAMNPTPLSHKWVKAGEAEEGRRRDWMECGGNERGWYYVDSSPDETLREYQEKSSKKHNEIQRCMINKGYQYNGRCDTSVAKTRPACVAAEAGSR